MPTTISEDKDALFLEKLNRQQNWANIFDTIDQNFEKVSEFLETFGRNTRVEHFTAQQGQEVFILGGQYNPARNCLAVYVNNIRQWNNTGFVETTKDSFKLLTPANSGDRVTAVYTRYYTLMDDLPEKYSNLLSQINEDVIRANQAVQQLESALVTIESYIHGGTGSRPGEDFDNAKYWAEEAQRNATNSGSFTLDASKVSYKAIDVETELDANRAEVALLRNIYQNLSTDNVRHGNYSLDYFINGLFNKIQDLASKYTEVFGENSLAEVIVENRDKLRELKEIIRGIKAGNIPYGAVTVADILTENIENIEDLQNRVGNITESVTRLVGQVGDMSAADVSYKTYNVDFALKSIEEDIQDLHADLAVITVPGTSTDFATLQQLIQNAASRLTSSDIRHGVGSSVAQALADLEDDLANLKTSQVITDVNARIDELEALLRSGSTMEGVQAALTEMRTTLSNLTSSDVKHGDSTVKAALQDIQFRLSDLKSTEVRYGVITVGAALDQINLKIENLCADDVQYDEENTVYDKIKTADTDSEALQNSVAFLANTITALHSDILEPSDVHNAVYRGRNLGSVVTEEQSAMIYSGSFSDIFVGDYWECNGEKFRVVGLNSLMNVGPTDSSQIVSDGNSMSLMTVDGGGLLGASGYKVGFNHVIVVPDHPLLGGRFPAQYTSTGQDVPIEDLTEYRMDVDAVWGEDFVFGGPYVEAAPVEPPDIGDDDDENLTYCMDVDAVFGESFRPGGRSTQSQQETPSEHQPGEVVTTYVDSTADYDEDLYMQYITYDASPTNPNADDLLFEDCALPSLTFIPADNLGSWYARTPRGWKKVTSSLLSEVSVFGEQKVGTSQATELTEQLPLFKLSPRKADIDIDYWLSDKSGNDDDYCFVTATGEASAKRRVEHAGYRPFFLVKGDPNSSGSSSTFPSSGSSDTSSLLGTIDNLNREVQSLRGNITGINNSISNILDGTTPVAVANTANNVPLVAGSGNIYITTD